MKKIIFIKISSVYSSIEEEVYFMPGDSITVPVAYLGDDYRYLIVNVD